MHTAGWKQSNSSTYTSLLVLQVLHKGQNVFDSKDKV